MINAWPGMVVGLVPEFVVLGFVREEGCTPAGRFEFNGPCEFELEPIEFNGPFECNGPCEFELEPIEFNGPFEFNGPCEFKLEPIEFNGPFEFNGPCEFKLEGSGQLRGAIAL
jgi:hypothetical protein